MGVVSHEQNLHDSHTLPEVLAHVETLRGKVAKIAVCDRGYRGKSSVNETQIILPKKALKRDTHYQKGKKRKQCMLIEEGSISSIAFGKACKV